MAQPQPQPLANPAALSDEFVTSSQALNNAARELRLAADSQQNIAAEVARMPQYPPLQSDAIQRSLTNLSLQMGSGYVNNVSPKFHNYILSSSVSTDSTT
jgi:hypothetical protein